MTTTGYAYTTSAITLPESITAQGMYFHRLTFNEYIPSGTAGTIKFYKPSESNTYIADDTATALYTYTGSLTTGAETYIDLAAQSAIKAVPGMKFKVTLTHTSGANMPYFGDLTLTYRSSPWLVTTEYPDAYIQNESIFVSIRFTGSDEMDCWGVGSATNPQLMPCRITVTFTVPMDDNLSFKANPEASSLDAIINAKITTLLQYLNVNTYKTYGYSHWRQVDTTQLTPIYAFACWSKTVIFSSVYQSDNT